MLCMEKGRKSVLSSIIFTKLRPERRQAPSQQLLKWMRGRSISQEHCLYSKEKGFVFQRGRGVRGGINEGSRGREQQLIQPSYDRVSRSLSLVSLSLSLSCIAVSLSLVSRSLSCIAVSLLSSRWSHIAVSFISRPCRTVRVHVGEYPKLECFIASRSAEQNSRPVQPPPPTPYGPPRSIGLHRLDGQQVSSASRTPPRARTPRAAAASIAASRVQAGPCRRLWRGRARPTPSAGANPCPGPQRPTAARASSGTGLLRRRTLWAGSEGAARQTDRAG